MTATTATVPSPSAALHELRSISLPELTEQTFLPSRTDRAYLVPIHAAHGVIAALAKDLRVLETAGSRTTRCRSTSYDTADLAASRAGVAVRRRDDRDAGTSCLEVESPGAEGCSSLRVRLPIAAAADGSLPGEVRWVVARALATAGVVAPRAALRPLARMDHDRTTLLLTSEGTRMTIDSGLTWTDVVTGQSVCSEEIAVRAPGGLAGAVVMTTEGTEAPGAVDRLLRSLGHRPRPLMTAAAGLELARGRERIPAAA